MTYEENLARLEQIVSELDGEGLDLDTALSLFEEGVDRLRAASAELARAEAQVKLLLERADGLFELGEAGG